MDVRHLQSLMRIHGIELADDDPVFLIMLLNEIALEDLDINRLLGRPLNIEKMQEVLLSNGIRVKDNDPIFALLGLNRIALERMAKTHIARLASSNLSRYRSLTLVLTGAAGGIAAGALFSRDVSHLFVGIMGTLLGAALGALGLWLLIPAKVATSQSPHD